MNRISLVIVALIILAFGLVLWFSDAVGMFIGKAGENAVLAAVAVILVLLLVKTGKGNNKDE